VATACGAYTRSRRAGEGVLPAGPVAAAAASCHNRQDQPQLAHDLAPARKVPSMLSLRVLLGFVIFLAFAARVLASPEVTREAQRFVEDHVKRLRPLDVAANVAWWDASTTGSKEAFQRKVEAQNKIDEALADRETFARLKGLEEKRAQIDDPVLARCIHILYLLYLEKQVDTALLKKMVEKSNAIEEVFNKYRAKVDGKEMTDNEVRTVLRTSLDSKRLQAVWEASKAVGPAVAKDLKELVGLRNQAAAKLGFKNYHDLQLYLNEQDGKQLLTLFDELDDLTREPFRKAKADIDARLAKRLKVEPGELMPWHYHDPFFQDTPKVFEADLDAPFKKLDILDVCRRFYAGIGLPIDRVIARSDLYEKKGKSPHAFCTDIDRAGDVRVLGNIDPNHYWAATMLHEFGHSVYSTNNGNIPESLPYPLRLEAHILTTEGVAMMFERLASRAAFLEKMGAKIDGAGSFDRDAATGLRYRLLIFSRWCQVMLRFEKGMYENPEQDLNKLWWDLVEKYQMQTRPAGRNAPDYASKIHIVVAPVYYHNYMMGELFASQLHHAIAREVYKGAAPDTVIYAGNKAVGDYLKKHVFAPGRTLDWDALTKYATGSTLNAKAFAADFQSK
jgi:peptidyl-dipeptidase A